MTDRFPDTMPLADARAQLLELLPGGVTCPCCSQHAREYRRPMTSVAARALAALFRTAGTGYAHMPTVARAHLADVASQGGYLTLAHHWHLMVEERTMRPDGGRAGWWAVTPRGEAWLRGRISVPRYARVYAGECLGLEGEPVTVVDVLADHFDLARLLGDHDGPPRLFDTGREGLAA